MYSQGGVTLIVLLMPILGAIGTQHVRQSSTYNGAGPSAATDGNYTTCSMTGHQPNHFFKIIYDESQIVHSVGVYTKLNVPKAEVTVRVGTRDGDWYNINHVGSDPVCARSLWDEVGDKYEKVFECGQGPLTGNLITVEIITTQAEVARFCEVELNPALPI